MIRSTLRRRTKRLLCAMHEMTARMSRPLFVLCMLVSVSPSVLLSLLLFWKSIFFSGAMPALPWVLFLPLWLFFSCVIPSFCASILLALPCVLTGRISFRIIPICTGLLLLSFLWALLLFYHMPYPLCALTAALSAVLALSSVPVLYSTFEILSDLLLLCGVWNAALVGVCIVF